jgi:hypothetical protein
MPDGTVSQETYTRELKTLPPDGFVELKMLPYHDMLVRRDKGSIMAMEQIEQGKKRGESTPKLTIESLQTWERWYMFKNCIVDHNITDKNGAKLDFRSEMTLHMLNPAVGMEIERLIDEINGGDDVPQDFPIAPTSSTDPAEQELQKLATMDTPTS